MAPLPHFNNVASKDFNVVYENLVEVLFVNLDKQYESSYLTEQITKIEGDIFTFCLNVDTKTKKIIPLDMIYKMYKKKTNFDIVVAYYDKMGTVQLSFLLKKCVIGEILNLVDMDYSLNNNIKSTKIRIVWEDFQYFSNDVAFKRYRKINKVLSKNN